MKLKFFVLAGLATMSVSSFANLRFDGTSGGQNVNITYLGNNRSVFAGRLDMFNLITNQSFYSICGDLDNTISNGQTWNCSAMLASAHSVGMGLAGSIVANHLHLVTTDDEKAGLQIAAWEAVYDGGVNFGSADFSNGDFQTTANATVLGFANTFYASSSLGSAATYFQPDPLNAGQGQLAAVPEPATMAVVAIGALAAMRRRRK